MFFGFKNFVPAAGQCRIIAGQHNNSTAVQGRRTGGDALLFLRLPAFNEKSVAS